MKLVDFWKNVNLHPGTDIAEDDYAILARNNLLITEQEYARDDTSVRARRALHANLPAEPFVGDVMNANVYIVTLNPRAGEYRAEYPNWADKKLRAAADANLAQSEKEYPFYYLNPALSYTDGAKYWIIPDSNTPAAWHKFDRCATELAKVTGGRAAAIKKIAQKVCDLELCPYHSRDWDDRNNALVGTLPSVRAMIDFLAQHVIPGVISGEKSLLVLRGVSKIETFLSGVRFDYNGEKIKFNDLDELFPDKVVFYRTAGEAQSASLSPDKRAGELLLRQLKAV